MKHKILLILFFLSFLLANLSQAGTIEGEVIKIADGDTITILSRNNEQYRIRLAEIDTPERGQPFANAAKKKLSSMIFRKHVRVEKVDIDRYGRIVGHVYYDKIHVNKEMVASGMAWAYRKYLKDQSFLKLESDAKTNNLGLWASKEASIIPPWEWRNLGQKSINQEIRKRQSLGNSAKAFTCGTKKYCNQMISCNEAKFHLNTCNVTTLDGDEDGVPCEKICRQSK